MLRIRESEKENFQCAFDAVESEIEHAMRRWKDNRPDFSIPDEEKSFECWVTWARRELEIAIEKAYYSYDKKEAMNHIRKCAGHLMRCMTYHGVDGRE